MTELKQDRSPHEAATDTVRRGMPSIAGAGSTWAIEAHGLRKSFGNQVVLDDIDFAVAKGTVFALLGPNGSGKTTTVQILSTLLPADGGVVRVAGYDVTRQPDLVRHSIGVTGQFSAVDNLLTGTENLLLMADLAHLERGPCVAAPPSCSNASNWHVPQTRPRPLIRAACGADWTWP